MKVCPNCGYTKIPIEASSCTQCGEIFTDFENPMLSMGGHEEPVDRAVSEMLDEGPEFVRGRQQSAGDYGVIDLGIESTSDLMEKEAEKERNSTNPDSGLSDFGDGPIGQSAPPPPPAWNGQEAYGEQSASGESACSSPAESNGGLKKLSDDEVKAISQNLYGSDSFINDRDKDELIRKINSIEDQPFSNTPIVPPRSEEKTDAVSPVEISKLSDVPKPKMAKKSKGIAYFYKNFIQIVGAHDLIAGDDLSINEREYTLRPKQIKRLYYVCGGAVAFALLLIVVGSMFVSHIGSGHGQLIGLVLDEAGIPYGPGATVRLPDLGISAESNGHGLFQLRAIPAGVHKVEYIVDGKIVKVDYATIADGQVGLLSLAPEEEGSYAQIPEQATSRPVKKEVPVEPVTIASAKTETAPTPPKPTPKPAQTTSSAKQSSTKATPGKIKLAANVDGARFQVDGSVLGAGNITYSGVQPGKHRYSVSLDGYASVEGSVTLSPGETKTLNVTLAPLTQAQKEKSFDVDDFFYSAKEALKAGNLETAIADLDQVIEAQPSNVTAVALRGEAYQSLKAHQQAHDDYVRAAEIYQVKKDYSHAITCYNKAVECDKKSLPAYLGRATVYLSMGEELAAITDFDNVLKIDKRNFQAYYGMGEARFKRSEFKKAIDDFKDARSIDSKNPLVHQYLILSYLALADYKNVKRSYEKFTEFASEKEMNALKSDGSYATVMKIVESQ